MQAQRLGVISVFDGTRGCCDHTCFCHRLVVAEDASVPFDMQIYNPWINLKQ